MESDLNAGESKKIDRRKLNLGRNSKKIKAEQLKQQQLQMAEETKNTEIPKDQQETINEMAKSGINPHPKEIKTEKIEEAKIINPEELSDAVTPNGEQYTPLNTKVKEEEYRNPFQGDATLAPNEPIEAPVFKKPDAQTIANAIGANPASTTPSSNSESKSTGTPMAERVGLTAALDNPDMNSASIQEKRQGAEQLVDGLLDGYALLHQLGGWVASVNMDKLIEKQIEGKIDLELPIPIDADNNTISLKEFLENYNHEAKKAITVSQDFIDKVRPVMIRVCEKNGWGLTDEQYLIYLFGRDLAEKTALIIAMKKGINQTLSILEKTHIANKQQEAQANARKPQTNFNSEQKHTETSSNETPTSDVQVVTVIEPQQEDKGGVVMQINGLDEEAKKQ